MLKAPLAPVLQGLAVLLQGECSLGIHESTKWNTANRMVSDAFTKREAAAEELYIRQEEKAKYVYKSAGYGYKPPHRFCSRGELKKNICKGLY
jgi:hypothetical protein